MSSEVSYLIAKSPSVINDSGALSEYARMFYFIFCCSVLSWLVSRQKLVRKFQAWKVQRLFQRKPNVQLHPLFLKFAKNLHSSQKLSPVVHTAQCIDVLSDFHVRAIL